MPMGHVILTCKHHTDLRWSCKDIAWKHARWNGERRLHYCGRVGDNTQRPLYPECACSVGDLVRISSGAES